MLVWEDGYGTGQGGIDLLKAALEVRGFVLEWLFEHILSVDADYARFIAAKS